MNRDLYYRQMFMYGLIIAREIDATIMATQFITTKTINYTVYLN